MPRNKKSPEANPETKEIAKTKKRKSKKRFLWFLPLIAIVVGGYFYFNRKPAVEYKDAYTVSRQDVRQSVIATGVVTSQSELNLSFKAGGIVNKINVKVGDKVKPGQVLASLDAKDAMAQVAVAQAGVNSAEVALKNAKASHSVLAKQQETLVNNAYAAMLSAGLSATVVSSSSVTPTITGTYTGKSEGSYRISPVITGDGLYYQYTGLESGSSPMSAGVPGPLGTKGLFITFATTTTSGAWDVLIPNKQSSLYITNQNAYKAALEAQEQQLTASLGAIDTAQAALESARAQLLVAQNNYSSNLITSPISGVVTSVDSKIGEQVAALREILVVMDPDTLHVETQVPESSISRVVIGQAIDMTFDAFGPNKRLAGTVTTIDPASTSSSGVINFRVLSSLPEDPNVKPGMTVNMSILTEERSDVIAVPNRLISASNGKKYVMVRNAQGLVGKTEVYPGLAGDNFTEITGGLSEGSVLVSEVK